MKGWIVFLSLCALVFIIHHSSVLLHNLCPSLRVVERKITVGNAEAKNLGYSISVDRRYFRKVVYEERRQTKGLLVNIQRDTISNAVYYEDDK